MNIVLIACSIFALQSILSFVQVRYYQKYMHKIAQQYSGAKGYHLYSAMERKRFGSSAIALMVIDDHRTIKTCQVLQGKSIFAKFKNYPQFQNQNLSQILNQFAGEQATRELFLWEKAIVKTANQVSL